MKIATPILLSLSVIATATANAEEWPDQIGNFFIIFGHNGMTDTTGIAATTLNGCEAVSFECMNGVPAIGFGVYRDNPHWIPSKNYVIWIQVNDKPSISVSARALSEHEMYVTEEKVFEYFSGAGKATFRIAAQQNLEGGTYRESLVGTDEAMGLVRESCGK